MERPQHQRFPKPARVVASGDYKKAQSKGRRKRGDFFTVWVVHNGLDLPRLGMAVSRKVGKSHDRQLLRRRIRELFRRQMMPLQPGSDHIVIARPGAAELSFASLTEELNRTMARK